MSYTSTRFGRRDLLKAGALIAGGAWVNISERAAVPKRIEFLEALPLTAVGKIFKPALQQREIGGTGEGKREDHAILYPVRICCPQSKS
nr:hypothetical protein [Pseudomonas sp. BIGb0427]